MVVANHFDVNVEGMLYLSIRKKRLRLNRCTHLSSVLSVIRAYFGLREERIQATLRKKTKLIVRVAFLPSRRASSNTFSYG